MAEVICWLQRDGEGFVVHIPGQGTGRYDTLNGAISVLKLRLAGNDVLAQQITGELRAKEDEVAQLERDLKVARNRVAELQAELKQAQGLVTEDDIDNLADAMTFKTRWTEKYGPVQNVELSRRVDVNHDGTLDLMPAMDWYPQTVPPLGWNDEDIVDIDFGP